jgi:hypothetical protein
LWTPISGLLTFFSILRLVQYYFNSLMTTKESGMWA